MICDALSHYRWSDEGTRSAPTLIDGVHSGREMKEPEPLDLDGIVRHGVDFEELAAANSEEPFLRVSFELLRESAALTCSAAGALDEHHLGGFSRNEAILVGHLVRMTKLMRAIIVGVATEQGGDQQSQISRQFLDSASTLAYLLQDPSDFERFDAYVFDSLIGEREFLREMRKQAEARGGEKLSIEDRIERSIQHTFVSAGVTEDEIPARRDINWPSAQTRLGLFGPTAYSAYRTGSGAIHGSWHDLERNHLHMVGDRFLPYPQAAPERPQYLLMMAIVGVDVSCAYVTSVLSLATEVFLPRFDDLRERLAHTNELHELFLTRSKSTHNEDADAPG